MRWPFKRFTCKNTNACLDTNYNCASHLPLSSRVSLPQKVRSKKNASFSWSPCCWAPLDLISQILQPILHSHNFMDMQVHNSLCPDFLMWQGRATKQLCYGYEMKRGRWFSILWQSAGWAIPVGSQDNDDQSQGRFLGFIKDCKSSGSSLQRLSVWKGTPAWLRKIIQQYYKKSETFIGHTFMLADLQLAEQLYRIWNKRAASINDSNRGMERWHRNTVFSVQCSARHSSRFQQKLSWFCTSIF